MYENKIAKFVDIVGYLDESNECRYSDLKSAA